MSSRDDTDGGYICLLKRLPTRLQEDMAGYDPRLVPTELTSLGELDYSAFEDLDPAQPGTIVGVISGGEVLHCRSFGTIEPFGAPLDRSSVFYVASIAKQFAAACIGLLVLDGQLSLEDDARHYIEEFPTSPTPVRIGHLLAHTSGLPNGHELDHAAGLDDPTKPFTTTDRLRVIITAAVEAEPGTRHHYSNYGYVVLAEVVNRVTGMTLGRFAANRLFQPLDMLNTGFLDASEHPQPVPGWTANRERVDVAFSCVGDGGLVTTIDDLALWDHWLPSSPLAHLMLSDRPVLADGRWAHDSWGISIRTHRGERIESHGGSITGYLASYVRFPRLSVSFIAFANSDAQGVEPFGRRLRQFVETTLYGTLDLNQPAWNETHGVPVIASGSQ